MRRIPAPVYAIESLRTLSVRNNDLIKLDLDLLKLPKLKYGKNSQFLEMKLKC